MITTNPQRRVTSSIGDFLDKVPPQDLEAERCVLGSLLLANESLDEVAPLLSASCFYMDAHRRIYKAIVDLLGEKRRTAVDAVTLRDELTRLAEIDVVGGTQYILQLLETVPHAAHAEYYAKIVREKWLQRSLIEVCTETLKEAYHGTDDVAALLERAESRMTSIVAFEADEVISMEEAVADTMEQLYAVIEDATALPGVEIRYPDLAELLVNFSQTCLYILAARPRQGKTALVLDLARHAAESGETALFFSVEMSYLELTRRVLSEATGITTKKILRGDVRDSLEDQQAIHAAAETVRKLPIRIFDGVADVAKIKQIARKEKRQHNVGLIVVDYLQLVTASDRSANREQQVSEISRSLKLLAKSLNVPVICLAQLNREVDKRDDPTPRLSDLRDSGAIEQDADAVIFLHVPHFYNSDLPRGKDGIAVLTVAKNRHGPDGSVTLNYDETCGRYSHRDKETQPLLPYDSGF